MKPLFFVAALSLTPGLAAAGPFGPHRGPIDEDRVMERVDGALDAVEATDEQREATRDIVDDALFEMQAYRDEGRDIRTAVRAAFEQDTVDRVALESARGDLVDLFDRATATLFGMFADVADLYTPEQRAEWRAIREARRAKWRQRLGLDDEA